MRCGALLPGVRLMLALVLSASAVRAQEPPPAPADAPPPGEPSPAPAPAPAPPPDAPAPSPVLPAAATPEPAPVPPPAPDSAPPPTLAPFPGPPPGAGAPPPSAAFPPSSPSSARPATAAPSSGPASTPTPVDAAAPAAPPRESPEQPDPEPEDDSHGVFGPFRIGPVLSFGLPSLLGFGGMVKLTRYFGAGVNVGLIPEVTFKYYGEAKVSYQDYSLYGHIHPFGGGFFLGAQVGYARVRGTYATTVDLRAYTGMYPGLPEQLAYTSRATVQTLVLTPEIGYFHIFGSGFSLGVDAGLQLPIAPSEITFQRGATAAGLPSELADRAFAPFDQKVRTTLEKVGRTILPAAHFRVGFLL
jgi:hypothetical protein